MLSPVLDAVQSALQVLVKLPISITFLFVVLAVLFVILGLFKRFAH